MALISRILISEFLISIVLMRIFRSFPVEFPISTAYFCCRTRFPGSRTRLLCSTWFAHNVCLQRDYHGRRQGTCQSDDFNLQSSLEKVEGGSVASTEVLTCSDWYCHHPRLSGCLERVVRKVCYPLAQADTTRSSWSLSLACILLSRCHSVFLSVYMTVNLQV